MVARQAANPGVSAATDLPQGPEPLTGGLAPSRQPLLLPLAQGKDPAPPAPEGTPPSRHCPRPEA